MANKAGKSNASATIPPASNEPITFGFTSDGARSRGLIGNCLPAMPMENFTTVLHGTKPLLSSVGIDGKAMSTDVISCETLVLIWSPQGGARVTSQISDTLWEKMSLNTGIKACVLVAESRGQ